jgi:hypothetical protein
MKPFALSLPRIRGVDFSIGFSPDYFRSYLFALAALLFLLAPMRSGAQERRVDLGLSVERAMNTISGMSMGARASFLVNVEPALATGVRTGYSHNFSDTQTLELAALCRWYFRSFYRDGPGEGPPESRLFAQIESGMDLILYQDGFYPAFLGGLVLGWRYNQGPWFFESSLRVGYPNIWGGVIFGFGCRL